MAKIRENSQPVRVVGWDECGCLTRKLAKKLPKGFYKTSEPYLLYGIPRGGVIIAVMISHIRPDLGILFCEPQEKDFGRLILIDDIVDSSKTMTEYFEKYKNPYTASLFCRCTADHRPQFKAETIDKDTWIKFPWETEI